MSHTSSIGKALALVGTRSVALQRRSAGCGVQGGWPGGIGLQQNMRTRTWRVAYGTGWTTTSRQRGPNTGATRLLWLPEFDGASSRSLLRVSRNRVFGAAGKTHLPTHYCTVLKIREAGIQLPPLKGKEMSFTSSLGDLALSCLIRLSQGDLLSTTLFVFLA